MIISLVEAIGACLGILIVTKIMGSGFNQSELLVLFFGCWIVFLINDSKCKCKKDEEELEKMLEKN